MGTFTNQAFKAEPDKISEKWWFRKQCDLKSVPLELRNHIDQSGSRLKIDVSFHTRRFLDILFTLTHTCKHSFKGGPSPRGFVRQALHFFSTVIKLNPYFNPCHKSGKKCILFNNSFRFSFSGPGVLKDVLSSRGVNETLIFNPDGNLSKWPSKRKYAYDRANLIS